MNNCHSCQHHRTIPGDCHYACGHPKLDLVPNKLFHAYYAPAEFAKAVLGISLNPHGVQMGWAAWPINFDPAWIENECSGFAPVDAKE